jgi:hypothetical protein
MSDRSRSDTAHLYQSSPLPRGYAPRLELGDMSTLGGDGDQEKAPLINEEVTHRVYDNRPTNVWEFAGFGSRTKVDDLVINESEFRQDQEARKQHHLGQFLATSISGAQNIFFFWPLRDRRAFSCRYLTRTAFSSPRLIFRSSLTVVYLFLFRKRHYELVPLHNRHLSPYRR